MRRPAAPTSPCVGGRANHAPRSRPSRRVRSKRQHDARVDAERDRAHACQETRSDGHDTQRPEPARGEEEHRERPEKVELLFDGQRPEVSQEAVVERGPEEREPVVRVEPEPRLLAVHARMPRLTAARERRIDDDRQVRVREGQDAQGAPRPESRQAPLAAPRIEQEARDQKPGEDEEEIDAGPPCGRHSVEEMRSLGRDLATNGVVQQNDQASDATQAVQGRRPATAASCSAGVSSLSMQSRVALRGGPSVSHESSSFVAFLVSGYPRKRLSPRELRRLVRTAGCP